MSTVEEEPASFGTACAVRSLGDGSFTADLRHEWSIGSHPHGGFLTALLAKAAAAAVREGGGPVADPLAVSAEFLRPPAIGPVLLRAEVRKNGRQATVVSVLLEQRGRSCVEARVTAGRLPARPPDWHEVPSSAPRSAEPPAGAVALDGTRLEGMVKLAEECDVRIDPSSAEFLTGRADNAPAAPRMRLWVRPRTAEPDEYFALLAGDINPPVVFNLGRTGWAPTAQLTALVRTRPAPGWLRVHVESRSVHEGWFDSDALVLDAQGRIVCQARQLALSPASSAR